MVHLDATVLQHQLEIAIADREHQIPAHGPQDHLGRELPALERLALPHDTCAVIRLSRRLIYPIRTRLTNLQQIRPRGTNLQGIDFSNAVSSDADFQDAKLDRQFVEQASLARAEPCRVDVADEALCGADSCDLAHSRCKLADSIRPGAQLATRAVIRTRVLDESYMYYRPQK